MDRILWDTLNCHCLKSSLGKLSDFLYFPFPLDLVHVPGPVLTYFCQCFAHSSGSFQYNMNLSHEVLPLSMTIFILAQNNFIHFCKMNEWNLLISVSLNSQTWREKKNTVALDKMYFKWNFNYERKEIAMLSLNDVRSGYREWQYLIF